jgi:Ser/Thr protein kinase RdoA (MazF antagonist)
MEHLLNWYRTYFNLSDAVFTHIQHEDATVAIVYKVVCSSGEQFILKICTRAKDYAHEAYFLNYFADSFPVPRVIGAVPPQENVYGALLMECLPGNVLNIADMTDALAFSMGALLARIHEHKADEYGDFVYAHDTALDPRVYIASKFNEVFAECSGHLPTPLLERCRQYFDRHIELLASVDGPCITHRDFRSGNIVAYNGAIEGVIDWSAARAGFAQEDFCNMEHWEWAINPVTKQSFLTGYTTIRPVPDYDAMMPLLRLNRAFNIIGFTLKRGTWQSKDARLYQFNRQFLENTFI